MRVAVDTTFLARGPTGTGVYLAELLAALPAAGVEVVPLAHAERRRPAGGGAGSARNLVADLRWSARELPRRARAEGAAVVHHPLPALAPVAGLPQVVTVHDLAFVRLPGCYPAAYRRWSALAHRAAARAAAVVVVPSQTTARDVRARWGVRTGRVVVAPHGPGQTPAGARPPRAPAHLLYLGDAQPRKNLGRLLAAYARYREGASRPLPLVLGGGGPGPAPPAAPGVRHEADPSAARVAALLAGAVALVQPSLHEGFGLTALEAMAAGVPVLAARAPGLSETCAQAALFFDPRDPVDIARALRAVHDDPALRDDLVARGRDRAAEFSWAACAEAHAAAYRLARG